MTDGDKKVSGPQIPPSGGLNKLRVRRAFDPVPPPGKEYAKHLLHKHLVNSKGRLYKLIHQQFI